MKHKKIKIIALSLACLMLTQSISIAANYTKELKDNYENVSTGCEADIVFDTTTGEILYEKNIHEKLYPASTTKLLTGLLAVLYGDLDDTVTFCEDAVTLEYGASTLDIKEGEKLTVKNCLYGLMLKSANEIANQLGYYVEEKSGKNFKEAANDKLTEIGCFESTFTNASGLHKDNHYTTVYDMALIANAAYKNDAFKEIFTTRKYTIPATNKAESRTVYNTHKMMSESGDYYLPSVVGGKTGFTDQAMNCLVTFSEDEDSNLNLIAAVFKGDGTEVTCGDTYRLLKYFNKNYSTKSILKKGDIIATVPLINKKGTQIATVDLTLSEDLVLTLPNNWNNENEELIEDDEDSEDEDKEDDDEKEIIEDEPELSDEEKAKLELENNLKILNYESDLFKIETDIPTELTNSVVKDGVVGSIKITNNCDKVKVISIVATEDKQVTESYDLTLVYIFLGIIFAIVLTVFIIKFRKLDEEEKEIK